MFRHLSTAAIPTCIKTVAVIGGGNVGTGIAQAAAQNARQVVLVELNQRSLNKAEETIYDSLKSEAEKIYEGNERNIEKYVLNTTRFITGTTDHSEAVKDTDLIIEAIPEDIDEKIRLFKRLNALAPPETIFATTTDSLSIRKLAEKSSRIERFVGLHFFHPAASSKLVEIVKNYWTSRETLENTTVVCNDSPGFIVNRLLLTYITEAIRMMEREEATRKDIDKAMRSIMGENLGPFEMADQIGHDTITKLVEAWRYREPENMIFQPCSSQKSLIEKGKLGVKSGEGYYKYDDLSYWVSFRLK
ncbi:unnamed protein product [Phyllotreta striolata]|uniref:3-hydroxyacyl-CoA dehydrogenase n=1 Tax=Phyllotreta striolata TaxID=444603 RepID=A0A9N9XMU8_PHYSR|nr:unnamed protein product [Phyllotreta striolata]